MALNVGAWFDEGLLEQAQARAQSQAANLWPTLGAGVSASRQAAAHHHAITPHGQAKFVARGALVDGQSFVFSGPIG